MDPTKKCPRSVATPGGWPIPSEGTVRFRLYPTPAQEIVLTRHCADARYIWPWSSGSGTRGCRD